MKSIKHKVIIGILSAGLFLALAAAVIQAIEHPHWGGAQFSHMFWGVLFGYWLITIPLVFPAISGCSWNYLQTLLAPLFCVAGIIVLSYVLKNRSQRELEGLALELVFMELLIFSPALLLTITSYCTIFKRKIFRIGLPLIAFLCQILISVLALLTQSHDTERCFFLIPLAVLPMIILDILMAIRLFTSMVNGK